MTYTFTTDTQKITQQDIKQSSKLAEKYFKTKNDPTQAPVSQENSTWISKRIPDCLNIIKKDKQVVGFSLIVPCTTKLMNQFLVGKITEAQLFEQNKKNFSYQTRNAIYLCAMFVSHHHRKKGLALTSKLKSIQTIKPKLKAPQILFAWPFSDASKTINRKLAQKTNLTLREKT